ncbi:hypothetical protein GUJ93_ZPchr0001g31112 [Zizania palustris]|uniref:3'-5' exonuclease domain-containing protein n=1 Tax=Zizania palustris TaxID=103762 RepID=A0A8J5VPW7_ZIZPA|nr:hypothetical protein GUJ93_ZPchr0001g31112 [Zizania palustris]
MAIAWASPLRRLLAAAGASARSFHSQPYQAKVGVAEILNGGVGKGVEAHDAKVESAVGGDSQRLLESCSARTLRLKKLGIPCKHINTTVAGDAEAADEWVRGVRANAPRGGRLIVGLDCEWKPKCHPSDPPNKVATLQLCTGTSCLILQLLYVSPFPASVRSLLGDPSVRFVGIGVGEDVAKLENGYGVTCAAPVDLQGKCNRRLGRYDGNRGLRLSGFAKKRRLGLSDFAREILGVAMEKSMTVTRSNWENSKLDDEQVRYACIDAYVSYSLGEKLLTN